MSDPVNDAQFAEIAKRLKLLTDAQIEDCRAMQEQMKGMGFPASLQEIAQRKEFINSGQLRQVQRALGIPTGKIPGYTILQKLAKGGMGVVYKARQNSVDRVVAIKVLSSLLTEDPNFVQRFMNEAKAVAKLSHRNIISVYDAGEAEGLYYFAMEFVEGKDLADIVRQSGPLSEDQARKFIFQAAEALRYIQSQGMIHRDIKPENLMLDKSGVLKLGDFGLAKMPANSGLTDPGSVMGTPRYISPEQARGEQALDIRSDLYSLGATLYFLMTGQPPYDGPTPVAVVLKHLNDPIPDPRKLRPDISAGMGQLVARLMEKDPAKRIQNPADLIASLRGGATQVLAKPARPRRRSMRPAALGISALLLAAAITFYFLPEPRRAPPPPAKPPADTTKRDPDPAPKPPDPVKARTPAEEGLALMKEKKWSEAAPLLKGAAGCEAPYKACLAEIEAAGGIRALEDAAAAKRWAEIEDLARRLSRSDTVTAGEHRADIDMISARAEKELAAEQALKDATALADAHKWIECLELLRKIDTSTAAYADNKERIEEIKRRHEGARRLAAEQEAEKLWNRAVVALTDKQYILAKSLFQDFLRDSVGTMFYTSRREDAMRRLRDCDDAMGAEKETKAKEIWDDLQKAKGAKDWAKATELLDRLERSFQETRVCRTNASAIADLHKSMEKEGRELAKIIDNFEEGIGKWDTHSEDVEKPKIAESPDAKEGKKSMKVTFAKMSAGDDAAMVIRPVEGLPKNTVAIKVWIKPLQSALRQQDLALVLFQQDEAKGGVSLFAAVLRIEAGWKEYTIPIREIVHTKDIGTVTSKTLQLERIKVAGLASFGRQPAMGYLIDGFRVETKE